jgi:hypothetical protein
MLSKRLGIALMGVALWAAQDRADGAEATAQAPARVDFATMASLPAPVARYFRHVLSPGQAVYTEARFEQAGTLRTSTRTDSWMDFTAVEVMSCPQPGFAWDAKVHMMPMVHLQVLDGYQAGIGAGQVKLFSLIPMGADRGTPELNSGALHRYLAEAVWFPVALLPRPGLTWRPIDDRRALATLTDHGTTVSLEFRFNAADEVEAVYTPARWGSFDGGYKQVAWEGHFRDYFEQSRMRIPRHGEVGWYDTGEWRAVWKGSVKHAEFRPSPSGNAMNEAPRREQAKLLAPGGFVEPMKLTPGG